MEDLQSSDELSFLPEQVEPIVYRVIEAVLKDKFYSDSLVQGEPFHWYCMCLSECACRLDWWDM